MLRRVSIFGATGSVGQNTLDLIRRRPNDFQIVALSGGRNIKQLAADALEFNAEIAVTGYDECLTELRHELSGSNTIAAAGPSALLEAAHYPADWTMSAIVGAAGLAPGLAALEQGNTVALANKESLVAAGALWQATAKDNDALVLPVDSEHSAIFQALIGEDTSRVERVIITASGGPFRDWPVGKMARASLEQALNHPNWAMGQRITIDSASMFNKAMEVIETKEYFGFTSEQIEVIIHPESLIHALVGYADGALMAHLGPHDMRHAIGFALNWPDRSHLPVDRLDLARISKLRFEAPDETRFPALRMAREVIQAGGFAGAVFNAAKETALDGFIDGQIGFMDMAGVVETVLDQMAGHNGAVLDLDKVLETDHLARVRAREAIAAQQLKG